MTKLIEVDFGRSVPFPEEAFDPSEVPTGIPLNSGHSEMHRWKAVSVMLSDSRERPAGLVDYIFTVPFKMVSLRFVNLLRSFHCECEYLPLIVRYHDQRLEGEYFALNALRVVDAAIDIEKSSIGRYYEEIRQARDVSKLVLDEATLGDAPLSFLNEIGRFAVSEKLAEAIADAGLIGVKLIAPEAFTS
jgi:hypothetical protein